MSIFHTGLNPLNRTKVVPVFLAINNEYAPYAAVAIHSLMQNANPRRYYRVIILHDGLSWPNRVRFRNLVTKNCAIQFKKITNSLYLKAIIKHCSSKKGAGDFFSAAVYYYRFFIPLMFPMYKKAVYIDSDTVLLGDIGELFDKKLSENVVLAMVDPKVEMIPPFRAYVDNAVGVPYKEYVNDGVMVMDLKKMRKMHYLSKMIAIIDKYDASLVAPDQDYLNVILRGKIGYLEPWWNMEPMEGEIPKEAKLLHFNLFNKPWRYKNVPQEDVFWNAARGTGFYGDLKRQQEAFDAKKQKQDHAKIDALLKKAAKLGEAKEPVIKLVEE